MQYRPSASALRLWCFCVSLCVAMLGCAGKKTNQELAVANSESVAPAPQIGFQPRHGDEIMVAGRHYRIGTPVVLWTDAGGYDAYRVERRFGPYEQSSWEATTQAMARKEVEFVSDNQTFAPARYSMRYNRSATQKYSPEVLDQIRGGGWTLEELQKHVDQFVLHYDVCGTSERCFQILHDVRGLSVHFMLDVDGTIYQTLDLKERAWHASKSNHRSIGIEIANMGAYTMKDSAVSLQAWYAKDASGKTVMTIPAHLKKGVRGKGPFAPRQNDLVVGPIHGVDMRMYDFTPQQYESLIKLTAALCDIFPQIQPDYPRDAEGKLITTTLSDDAWRDFKGIIGHYHIQPEKQDPGPAMDWEYLIQGVRERLKEKGVSQ
jgi:N-acetylmuramoyl-L-alanine amidase